MAFDDLRSFLQALDDQGQLLKISEAVNAEPDLAAGASAMALPRCGLTIFAVLPMRAWQ